MPKTPSKRATANVMPGCFTASANCWPGTDSPATYRREGEVAEECHRRRTNGSYDEMIQMSWPLTLRNAVRVNTYGDRVLADETRQAASAVLDGELCAVLHVRAGLFGVVAVVKPWWEKKKVTLKFLFYFKNTAHHLHTSIWTHKNMLSL